jgi:hypothetical protein
MLKRVVSGRGTRRAMRTCSVREPLGKAKRRLVKVRLGAPGLAVRRRLRRMLKSLSQQLRG